MFTWSASQRSYLNPFSNTHFWDRPKFKDAADNNSGNVATNRFKDTDCKENIVEKGEIAHFEQFHLFLQCFSKGFFFNVLKYIWRKGLKAFTPLFTLFNPLPDDKF